MEDSNKSLNMSGAYSIPVLGKALPTRKQGYYGVVATAVVGTQYAIFCPECGKVMRFKAVEARVHTISCDKCEDVKVIVKAVDKPMQQKKEEVAPQGKVERQDLPDGGKKTPQAPQAPQQLTKKYKQERNETNAKLVWYTLLGRKKYVLREGKNYIGRKDEAMPSDLSLKDNYASARSVCIEVTKRNNGYVFHLSVERASNPVLVRGKECPVGSSFDLNYNDTIVLGSTTLTLKAIKK